MKRYTLVYGSFEEDAGGNWVRWSDVIPLMRLLAEIEEENDQNVDIATQLSDELMERARHAAHTHAPEKMARFLGCPGCDVIIGGCTTD